MNNPFKSTLLVTLFLVLGQGMGFFTQMAIAAFYGANANMDAFLAANVAPQYLTVVLIGSLNFVFMPIFVDYMATGRVEDAWKIASSILNICFISLSFLIVLGMAFSDVILRAIAPGLPESTYLLAVKIALVTWPTVLAVAASTLLAGIYQSQFRFGWPALAPVMGAAATLIFVVAFSQRWGIVGLAVATAAGLVIQTLLLLPIVLKMGCYRFLLDWRHPGCRRILSLLAPLLLANIFTKSTPVVERFLASSMPEGSISHLNYAFCLSSSAILLLSTGIGTVIFPRMAVNMASNDLPAFRQSLSTSLRFMWLAVAPAISIGMALSFPLVTLAFQRGNFNATDSMEVAQLLRIYLLSVTGACLGSITSRGFYVLKDTRTIAVFGGVESIAYLLYTPWLALWGGTIGIAWSYVIFMNISLLWQIIVLRYKIGNIDGPAIINSFIRVSMAAFIAGIAAWELSAFIENIMARLILCGITGAVAYVSAIFLFRVPEAFILLDAAKISVKQGRTH